MSGQGTGGGGGIIIPQDFTQPFQAFGENLLAWVHTKETEVGNFLANFLPQVAGDIEQAVEVGLEDIASIAGEAVLEQAGSVLSGSEKFGTAVTTVVQKVESGALGVGKTIAISTAQTGVQQAFQTLRNLALANAPPTTS